MEFDEIFDSYFPKVYSKVYSMVNNSQDAEDICQEVFISVYKSLSKFRKESNLYTWVYRIAINKTYDFYRKRKQAFELDESIYQLEDIKDMNTNILLEERLKKIDSREKEVIILKDIYGYKFREISKLKNLKLSTVKSIYYKGIKDMGGI